MNPPVDPKAIAGELCQFARANLVAGGAAFDESSSLAEAGVGSFAFVELLIHCERAFGVRVPESHLNRKNLASVTALARCIVELAGAKPAVPVASKQP
jgi:acyl carrier protein